MLNVLSIFIIHSFLLYKVFYYTVLIYITGTGTGTGPGTTFTTLGKWGPIYF
jgi:hypothetical protein